MKAADLRVSKPMNFGEAAFMNSGTALQAMEEKEVLQKVEDEKAEQKRPALNAKRNIACPFDRCPARFTTKQGWKGHWFTQHPGVDMPEKPSFIATADETILS